MRVAPMLWPGQVVILENLAAHKSKRVLELIEGRGCQVLCSWRPNLAGSLADRGGVLQGEQRFHEENGGQGPRGARRRDWVGAGGRQHARGCGLVRPLRLLAHRSTIMRTAVNLNPQ